MAEPRDWTVYVADMRRDVLAHAYFSLEDDTLWQVISESVPALHRQLNAINLNQAPTP